MDAKSYGPVDGETLPDPSMTWNQPDNAEYLAIIVTGWLCEADPAHAQCIVTGCPHSRSRSGAGPSTEHEEEIIAGQDVIVMVQKRDTAEQWLGLDVVGINAPEFCMWGEIHRRQTGG